MNKDFIRISQYNIEGAMNKKPLFIKYLYDNDIDICLLNETWLRDKNTFNIPSYNFVYQNGKDGRCGVGILVKNHLKYTVSPTPFYEFLQTTAIILSTNAGNLTLLCAYSPPTNNNQRRFQGRRLKQILNDLPKPIMLSGDLNAHHVAFGCLSTNSRGSEIYNIIDEYDLCILNTGTPTTVGSPNKNPSAIDISCISPSLASLCHWRVHDDSMGSYHFPTIIDIQTSVHKYEIGSPIDRFVYSKADWLKFLSKTPKNDEWIPSFLDKYAPQSPPEQQFGFRKGRSAAESFTSLVEDIKNSFHGHSATVCAFLDVQGAFDNVNPSVLIQILSEIGIPGHI